MQSNTANALPPATTPHFECWGITGNVGWHSFLRELLFTTTFFFNRVRFFGSSLEPQSLKWANCNEFETFVPQRIETFIEYVDKLYQNGGHFPYKVSTKHQTVPRKKHGSNGCFASRPVVCIFVGYSVSG